MAFALVLDILVAGLLIVTISYAVMLNRRLRVMRQDKSELEKLAAKFAESTIRAEESIARLRRTADELKAHTDKAQNLREDLAFLIDRGGSMADRLEDEVRNARKKMPQPEMPASEPPVREQRKAPARAKEESRPQTDAERELIRALRSAR